MFLQVTLWSTIAMKMKPWMFKDVCAFSVMLLYPINCFVTREISESKKILPVCIKLHYKHL